MGAAAACGDRGAHLQAVTGLEPPSFPLFPLLSSSFFFFSPLSSSFFLLRRLSDLGGGIEFAKKFSNFAQGADQNHRPFAP